MTRLAQYPHDPLLLCRRELGKHARTLRRRGELLVVQVFEVGAEQDMFARQPHLAADAGGDLFVVARQNFDGHAQPVQARHRGRRRFLGRVEEGEVADEHHFRLVRRAHLGALREPLLRNREHAHALLVQRGRARKHAPLQFARERSYLAAHLREGGHGEHLLHRALGDEEGLPLPVRHRDAHAAALEIEGYFVRLLVFREVFLGNFAARAQFVRALDDGDVHQIFQPRLVVAVEEGAAENARVLLSLHVQVHFEHDFILR